MPSADEQYFVYLIACRTDHSLPVKIGKTKSLARRLSNIQTGCPYQITHAFTITSEYQEEVDGLEKLLHQLLKNRTRGEWYDGSDAFFLSLHQLLRKINSGEFTYEEIEATPDFCGPELEIMLHSHDFKFAEVILPIRAQKGIPVQSKTIAPEDIVKKILGK